MLPIGHCKNKPREMAQNRGEEKKQHHKLANSILADYSDYLTASKNCQSYLNVRRSEKSMCSCLI